MSYSGSGFSIISLTSQAIYLLLISCPLRKQPVTISIICKHCILERLLAMY